MTEPYPHDYFPSVMHNGDCSVCGNLRGHPLHSPTPTAGEARVTEIARIIDPDDFEHEWAFETARAIASLPASPPGEGVVAALEFYRDGFSFQPKRSRTGVDLSTWIVKPELLEDCGQRAIDALSRLTQGGDAELGDNQRLVADGVGAIRTAEQGAGRFPVPNNMHWLGDRHDAEASGHATDMRGCVLYFELQSDCLQFMRFIEAAASNKFRNAEVVVPTVSGAEQGAAWRKVAEEDPPHRWLVKSLRNYAGKYSKTSGVATEDTTFWRAADLIEEAGQNRVQLAPKEREWLSHIAEMVRSNQVPTRGLWNNWEQDAVSEAILRLATSPSPSPNAGEECIKWLRWGLEEICRGTDMRAGNGHAWEFGIAMEALHSAGFNVAGAGIQKPTTPLPTPPRLQPEEKP